MNNADMPKDATHEHEGNFNFHPHFIKVEGDKVYTWLTGFKAPNCWSDIPAHDDLDQYIELQQLEGGEDE